MNKKSLRQADLIMSTILFVFSIYVAIESIRLMLSTLDRGIGEWYSSPGLLPLIIGILLCVCSIDLFRTAWKFGARYSFINKSSLGNLVKSKVFINASIVIALIAIYIFLLLKFLPYWLATFIFLFCFISFFKGKNNKELIIAFIISASSTAILTYGFGTLAQIPLP
ncbi:MAG: tripartite tricarboxylate transporter TctB family protein [Clostridiaceae bacterium]